MVIGLVLKQSLRLTAIGIAAGVVLGAGATRLISSQMIFLRVFDGAAFGSGVLVVLLTALAAGYVPSRRAAQIDPIQTLRYD
jgi:ABC-type antimicrobial peptide transport system permease subunit